MLEPVFLGPYLYCARRGIHLNAKGDCDRVFQSLVETGLVSVRDPRAPHDLDARFRRMLEDYFRRSPTELARDVRPDLHYQSGLTPEGTELARDHTRLVRQCIDEANQPVSLNAGPDPKMRFFIRSMEQERPQRTRYPALNAPPVIPDSIPEWAEIADHWRCIMRDTIQTVLEMLAIGAGASPNLFTDLCRFGPHLMGPTGTDLNKYGAPGISIAKFHYDFNILTGHGKASCPGLFVLDRKWRRMLVRLPDECFLMQAGRQLSYLTGGEIMYGFHEVVACEEMQPFIEGERAAGRTPIRVSTSFFYHVASDRYLRPLGPFATPERLAAFPRMTAGRYSNLELEAIGLKIKRRARAA